MNLLPTRLALASVLASASVSPSFYGGPSSRRLSRDEARAYYSTPAADQARADAAAAKRARRAARNLRNAARGA